jgi:hypothetical protein
LRAAAQMVSYEVSIGFVLIPVVLWAGTFNLSGIVLAQQGHIFGLINGFGFNPLLFPMAVIFLISSMAETARAPFDLTEAESELVAGYQTEYSSMSFALFWLGEYGNVILMCGMNALLFWGGWLPPIDWAPLYVVPGIIWFFAKIFAFFFIFSWVKATVPRYRYDQLMRLGWKIFLPISLIWVVLVSGYLMLTRYDDRSSLLHPTAQTLAAMNASDACFLLRAEKYGVAATQPVLVVYLYRPESRDQNRNLIEIRSPSEFAGRYQFRQESGSGFGGSGSLVPLDQSGRRDLGFAQTDVLFDGRNAAMLSVGDESQPLWGDCKTRSELGER